MKARLLFMACLLAFTVSAQTERKVGAILIANNAYASNNFPRLDFAVNDLQRIHRLVTDLNIDTNLVIEAKNINTSDEMLRFVDAGSKIFTENNVTDILFYYSGHGVVQNGESYMVPCQFSQENLSTLYTGINDYVINFINQATTVKGPNWDAELTNRLRMINMASKAVPLSKIGEKLTNFNLVMITDACRSKMPDAAKSATAGAGMIKEEGLMSWIKNNGNPKKKLREEFVAEFTRFYADIDKKQQSISESSELFRNTLTTTKVRKPVTIIYGTTYFNEAIEIGSLYSSAFTDAFDKVIRNCKQPGIRFDDNFTSDVSRSITSVEQYPVIDGWRSFELINPFLKEQIVNTQNINRALGNKPFKAINLQVKQPGTGGSPNYVSRYKSIYRVYDSSQVKSWTGFKELTATDTLNSCGKFRVNVFTRIPSLSVLVEKSNLNLYHEDETSIVASGNYNFKPDNCELVISDPASVNNGNREPLTIRRNYDDESEFQFINDSTISFSKQLNIPSFGTFSEMTVHRISPLFDTVYVEMPDLYNNTSVLATLVLTRSNKKLFAGPKIPYQGVLNTNNEKLVLKYGRSVNYYPTNVPVTANWKNGRYTATVNMQVELDTAMLNSANASLLQEMKKKFALIQANDISSCTDPKAPESKADTCFRVLAQASYGLERVMAESSLTMAVNYNVIASDPTALKLSIPFSFVYPDYIKSIKVSSLLIENLQEFTDREVKQILDSLQQVRMQRLALLQQEELARRIEQARLKRLSELTNYRLEKYSRLAPQAEHTFNGFGNWEFTFNYNGTQITLPSAKERNGRLEVMQGGNYNYYDHGVLPSNYQVDAEMMFDISNGKQYFYWGGDKDASMGYYFSPEKVGSNYYLVLGYRQLGNNRELGRINISSVDGSLAKDLNTGSRIVKITIRKYADRFYVFLDEQYAGQVPYQAYDTYSKFIIYNNVPVSKQYVGPNRVEFGSEDFKLIIRKYRLQEIRDFVE